MAISDPTTRFHGLPVVPFDPERGVEDPGAAIRIHVGWDEAEEGQDAVALIEALAGDENAGEVRALLIGDWGQAGQMDPSEPAVAALVEAADRLPALEALFLGDMTFEDCEISWIEHGDLTALFEIESLKELWIRGGAIELSPVKHVGLEKLVFQSGGLPFAVPSALASSELPALRHLELWLGTDEYGGPSTADAVKPLLARTFPSLRTLGLRNAQIADEVAKALHEAPILDGVEALDLSLGTLSDVGVQALIDNPRITKLKRLDVHHHYASDVALAALQKLGPEVTTVGADSPDDDGDPEWRFVAHSE
ncbi:MAG TPA: cytoplasmic protein [Myxococcales bacterium]|nr:cytoplasmic protein [Myxococcales bacterium]